MVISVSLLHHDELAARLQEVCAQGELSPRFHTPSPSSTEPENQYTNIVQYQTESYNALVGRPSHPLSLKEDIVESTTRFYRFGKAPDDWEVFGSQLVRWEDFRMLQKIARGQNAYNHWRDIWEGGHRRRRFAACTI
jgi:hypothetical protein